jgi:hypothetical protein
MEQHHLRLSHWRMSRCTKCVQRFPGVGYAHADYSFKVVRASLQMAVASGILLGVFEGVGVLLNRFFSEGTRAQLPPPGKRRPSLYVVHCSCHLLQLPTPLLHPSLLCLRMRRTRRLSTSIAGYVRIMLCSPSSRNDMLSPPGSPNLRGPYRP